MRLSEARLSIVGLGLMGGSLARALQGKVAELIGMDWDPQIVELASELEIFDRASNDLHQTMKTCDLVVLATPVRAILDTLKQIGRDLPTPPRVFDIGSTKVEILQAMNALPKEVDVLGGHPLCGKERMGLANSDAELYRDKNFVITPLERTSDEMLDLIEELIAVINARPLSMDAERHDRLVAVTSHLPYLMAVTLISVAMETSATDDAIWDLIASGFIDTSRLAASEVTIMSDILLTNRGEIQKALDRAITNLQELSRIISSGDADKLFAELTLIRSQRASLGNQQTETEESDGNPHYPAG
jgi:prephenate dehydrogenase